MYKTFKDSINFYKPKEKDSDLLLESTHTHKIKKIIKENVDGP